MIPLIILNWNGEDDSLSCLESLCRADMRGFLPVVVDNGSQPENLQSLKQRCMSLFRRVVVLQGPSPWESEIKLSDALSADLVIIENGENLGFAGGCNNGVRFAQRAGLDWVMLLNNDTSVAPDALAILRAFVAKTPRVVAVTPQIRYMSPSSRVHNCGGRLTYFGSRKYAYLDRDRSEIPRRTHDPVTFLTGCALMFNHKVTGPLTDAFFFGEEDYEFCLRAERQGMEMACVYDAVVYHKVGASVGRVSRPLGGILVQYASRLINTRNYYSSWRWYLTKLLSYCYLPLLLSRNGINPVKAVGLISRIESHLRSKRGVDREDFLSMIRSTW